MRNGFILLEGDWLNCRATSCNVVIYKISDAKKSTTVSAGAAENYCCDWTLINFTAHSYFYPNFSLNTNWVCLGVLGLTSLVRVPRFRCLLIPKKKVRKDMSTLKRKSTIAYHGKYHGYDPITFIKREAVIQSRREDKEISRLNCQADPSLGWDFSEKGKQCRF